MAICHQPSGKQMVQMEVSGDMATRNWAQEHFCAKRSCARQPDSTRQG